jgi:hypothetical protein
MGIHTCLVAIKILRAGDGYQGTVGPPEVSSQWSTDHPYGRDELRWKIESMGAHPIDAADAFPAADVRRDSALKAFRDHGVTGDVRVAMSLDEAVFVLSSHTAAHFRGAGLDAELQQLLGLKVCVTTESEVDPERSCRSK